MTTMASGRDTLGAMFGTLDWIDAHLSRAAPSLGRIEAICKMVGNWLKALVTGP